MKILELTNFSAGICGVWQRVKQESEMLSKNHEVLVLSSNIIKGTENIAPEKEIIGKIKISRFPAKKLGGESFMKWLGKDAEKIAIEFKLDAIFAHSYRHLHTLKALKLAQKTGAKCFLITHAPFERKRGIIQNSIVYLYDLLVGKRTINKFDRIIAITKWEIPYFKKLGISKEKIAYIPNGIPDEFFRQKNPKIKEENKILFLGRIAPIKNIEILIKSASLIKDKKIFIEIVGPVEKEYFEKLEKIVKEFNLEKKIVFSPPVYNLAEKIKKIDSCKIFVLPSISEGMPQSLIEAMARGKIVIASRNSGNADLIQLWFDRH